MHRRLLENPIWTQLSPAVLKVSIYFLLRANYRPTQWYDGKQSVQIPAGAFITSYGRVAKDCKLSIQQVRDAFTHLFGTQFATYRRTHRWTLVIISNWTTYQSSTDERNTLENTEWNFYGTPDKEIKNKTYTLSAGKPASEKLFDIDNPPFSTLDPELIPEAENGNGDYHSAPAQNGTSRAPKIQEVIARVAARIHQRHPGAFGRRDLSAAGVERKLASILKHKRIPASDQEAYLERIDRNHAAMCASEGWQKDGGQFAKGLDNWLAPTKERYDVMPEPAGAPTSKPMGPIL